MSTATSSAPRADSSTSTQAYLLAAFCLVLGVGLGYLFSRFRLPGGNRLRVASSPKQHSPPEPTQRSADYTGTAEGNGGSGSVPAACNFERKS